MGDQSGLGPCDASCGSGRTQVRAWEATHDDLRSGDPGERRDVLRQFWDIGEPCPENS